MQNKGTIESVSGDILSLRHSNGTTSNREVTPAATVTLNGNEALLNELIPGDVVTLNGDPATSVKAIRSFQPAPEPKEVVTETKGTITGISDGALSIRLDSDPSHALEPDADLTLNGKPAKLSDLHAGDRVTLVCLNPVTKVVATR